ncbi:hypothetical protein [Streptomyces luteireticuli]|uniref:hypothetical protein n=1 Tax=Streptomyces luteireticuli TaxID=173858 RepID=UPI0035591002
MSTEEEHRPKAGPRHAAPRKPLLARLHMPVGKAVALAAMPTAVLMGMGFTPQLAQAKPTEPPNPFGDAFCLTTPDQSPSPDATPGTPSPSASPSPDVSRTADDEGKADKPKKSKETVPPSPSRTPKPEATPTPTPTPSPSEDLLDKLRGKLPRLPLPVPPATSSPSPTPTPTPPPTDTPTPTPSAKSATPTPPTSAVKKQSPSPTPKATPQPHKTLDVPETPEATDTASPSATPSPTPTSPDEKTPKPCPTPKAGADRKQAGFANNPWFLESSKLTLRGLTYQGIKEITTVGGQKKSVVKFTADGLDIRDLHALVNDRGRVYHQSGPGKTSTIRGGEVTLYTEELKGKLLGIPMTINASHPPPLIPGLKLPIPISYTDVKIRQGGQYGGTLTIPNMKVYITDGTYP